ncbi:MAG: ACT domain-containing protein [Cyanobacteria bacterium P01_C01_bin.120]
MLPPTTAGDRIQLSLELRNLGWDVSPVGRLIQAVHRNEMSASPIGETQLSVLLASLQPQLQPAIFVFATVAAGATLPPDISPVCQFQEAEGVTVILRQDEADQARLPYQYPCRMITLTIHSSLEAVGMLAAVTQALAAEGISTNVVSAYFHDHLFVACDRAQAALNCLRSLAAQSGSPSE